MSIINLTQHAATVEQIEAGVFDLSEEALGKLKSLLTFDTLPSCGEIKEAASAIADIAAAISEQERMGANLCDEAMIGGAPWFMAHLVRALQEVGINPLFAFSVRESVEQAQADGSVRKVMVFRHAGFVLAC